MILALGKSSTRVMPSVTSVRYAPGLGMTRSSRECAVPLDTPPNSHCQPQKHSVSLLQSVVGSPFGVGGLPYGGRYWMIVSFGRRASEAAQGTARQITTYSFAHDEPFISMMSSSPPPFGVLVQLRKILRAKHDTNSPISCSHPSMQGLKPPISLA